MAKKLFYKIGEACKKVDVQPYVLRYWETEFDLLSPDKSKSGQRVYTEDDLAIIRRIKELLYDEGYTTVGAKKKLQAELKEGGGKLPPPSGTKASPSGTKASSKKGSDGDAAAEDSPSADSDEKVDSEDADPEDSAEPEDSEQSEEPGDDEDEDEDVDEGAEGEAESDPSDGRDERIEQLEDGIRTALKQARKILQRLEESA